MNATTIHTVIKVQLAIRDRWAVGTWAEAESTVQMVVLADPRHGGVRPHLPGTSLAGSLKRHLRGGQGDQFAKLWMGAEPADYGVREGEVKELPGRLTLLGCLPIEAPIRSRGVTRVDLERGAAEGGSSRTEQWVDPTTVTLVARHDGPRDLALLSALTTWQPVVGRSRTTGMGRARVSAVASVEVDDANPAQLGWWLTERDGWLRGDQPPPGVAARDEKIPDAASKDDRFVQVLVVAEPVHVGVSKQGEKQPDGRLAATTMRVRGKDGHEVLVVPGASWKGVFRHRIEVILTAVGASVGERDTIIQRLFGHENARGLLEFRDSVTTVQGSALRTHVSIDRFTSGARDSALHRTLSIPRGTELRLSVAYPAGATAPIRNLLEHVVNDLHDGLVTVGGHGTRGYGWVRRRNAKSVPQLRAVTPAEVAAACGVEVPGRRDPEHDDAPAASADANQGGAR